MISLPSRTQSECCICEMRSESGESAAGISGVWSNSGRSLSSLGNCGMVLIRGAVSRVVVKRPFSCAASSSSVVGSASLVGRGCWRISFTLSRSFVLLLLYPSRHDESLSGTEPLSSHIEFRSFFAAFDWAAFCFSISVVNESISVRSCSLCFLLHSMSCSFDMLCSPRKNIPFSAS